MTKLLLLGCSHRALIKPLFVFQTKLFLSTSYCSVPQREWLLGCVYPWMEEDRVGAVRPHRPYCWDRAAVVTDIHLLLLLLLLLNDTQYYTFYIKIYYQFCVLLYIVIL